MKHFFKNNKGMTYVELLVAFTLLVLVITVFSPMLLSSYGTLYNAGEKNINTYSAKSQVEDELAYRSSTDIVYNLQTNFKNIGEMAKVNVRRITESLTGSYSDMISTLFYNGKGYIRLISSSRVNDDANSKTFVFQTSGFTVDNVVYNGTPAKTSTDGGKTYHYVISLAIYVPDKTKASQQEAYAAVYDASNVHIDTTALSKNGIIRLTVKGVDMTDSPIRMVLSYYDENAEVPNNPAEIKEISSFLYIDAPTIMLGGDSVNDGSNPLEYFTSAGLSKDNAGNMSLQIDGRDMTGLTYASGTSIKNISWIDNDTVSTDKGYKPYYVLTGTNGTIARLHFSTDDTAYGEMKDRGITNELPLTVTDKGVKRTFYPIAWGGDVTEQFGYSTFYRSMGYRFPSVKNGGTSCWYTQDGVNGVTADAYKVFSTQARYAYYFDGWRTDYDYSQQNGRKISYVLTEANSPLRVVGNMENVNSFTGYNDLWESDVRYLSTGWGDDHTTTQKKVIKTYSAAKNIRGNNVVADKNFAYLNIKSFNNLSSANDYLFSESKYAIDGSTNSRINYLSNENATKSITVTGAVFDERMGGMFYTGTVESYIYLNQTDNTNSKKNYSDKVELGASAGNIENTDGTFTGYYMRGTNNGSTIKKASEGSGSWGNCANIIKASTGAATVEKTGNDLVNFYVNRSTSLAETLLKDVNITFGFSSNRAKVYSDITIRVRDGEEQYKSYEKYYFLSHYGISMSTYDDNPNAQAHYYSLESGGTGYNSTLRNSVNNDYYNVWFPGEFYNITKTVAKEGVVVGVGYAVSGSTFQWVNPSQTTNTSTALGSVYNDGVLAVKTDVEDVFTNKLYFKDNATFDGTSLSGKTEYKNVFGTYGTHSRKSIQFTAVDILVEGGVDDGTALEEGQTDTKTYTAFYGDNTGRVFKSLVATAIADTAGDDVDVDETTKTPPTTVEFIADTTYAGTKTPPSTMEEIKLPSGNTSVSVSTVFDEITNIVCEGSTVIISGTTKAAGAYVVIGKKAESGTWTWKAVKITDKNYIINDATVCEGVYYACGEVGSKGFFMAVDLGDIDSALNNSTTSDISQYIISTEKMVKPSSNIGAAASTDLPKLYSIAARGSGE